MLLTKSFGTCKSEASIFKMIEASLNKLTIASLNDKEETSSFLLKRMDIEAASFERNLEFKNLASLLRDELESKNVTCKVYRFQKDNKFGGYTFCLSNLLEDGEALGKAYLHLVNDSNFQVSASLKYFSPYSKKVSFTDINKNEKHQIWLVLGNLGYEKPKSKPSIKIKIESYIQKEEQVGTSKCIDLKSGTTMEIAKKVMKRYKSKFKDGKIIESTNKITILLKNPKKV